MTTCPNCGTENKIGAKFCGGCAAPLSQACPACGAVNDPGMRFCNECANPLSAAQAPVGAVVGAATAGVPAPAAERRLVSILFADLVGFTSVSEGRDSEDTRELLTRYFETSRTIIERYGGTVEKFIGDAVMAVWGAPVATEDDAERAVRAALDLVDAIPSLDPALAARAGVLTGEAAVTLGATDQGLVAGDIVNTASRIQSVASPGSVLVGERTYHATDASIAYEDAGEHTMKGKAEAQRLWRALRVTAQRRGEGRSAGLEAPFVGRGAELRLVKELFQASAEQSRARLVSVLGVAGIGKTRLSREFEKHLDGLAGNVWWHRGRCLSYGEGVAYWALAEMVRGRARVVEDESAEDSVGKVRAMLVENVADAEERDWIEPRLLHLLGLADRSAPDREDLFSAWRRFFERLAERAPVVLVFEDIHWADEGLAAFIEYLLDWGRHHPIFVLTLARPELADRHPGFPGSNRSATTLPLEPLDDASMDELLSGLVPGLPADVRERLRDAADGIPLYAVETVRMLRDRGVLAIEGDTVVVTGDPGTIQVPETLHALIASRLDSLGEPERRLLQDASVLGKTFTTRGLSALSGLRVDEVDRLVEGLVRKEFLTIENDHFSPERGQLGFLQALVQRVTYETIARRDRRRRHLEAARFLAEDGAIDPDEIAEVIASHYLDAHEADPDAADADAVRADARAWFTRAAERAASLAASLEAQRGYERAAGLSADDVERGTALKRAGELAAMGGRLDEAEPLLTEAIAILGAAGLGGEAAGAEAALGELLWSTHRLEEAIERLDRALSEHDANADESAVATVSAHLGRFEFFAGHPEVALEHVERALDLSEKLHLYPVVVEALITKALILQRRPNEAVGLIRQALALSEETGLQRGAIRACMNLGYLYALAGRNQDAKEVTERGIEIARLRGDRVWERALMANLMSADLAVGRWDELIQHFVGLPDDGEIVTDPVHASVPLTRAVVAAYRGDGELAVALAAPFIGWRESARVQTEGTGLWARVITALAEGRTEDMVAECLVGLRDERMRHVPEFVEPLVEYGGDAAFAAGSLKTLREIHTLAEAAPIEASRALEALLALQRARMAALEGAPEPPFAEAVAMHRALGEIYRVAVAQLDQAGWLRDQGRTEEAATCLGEARSTFEHLGAAPKLLELERVESALASNSKIPALPGA